MTASLKKGRFVLKVMDVFLYGGDCRILRGFSQSRTERGQAKRIRAVFIRSSSEKKPPVGKRKGVSMIRKSL